MRTGQQSIRDVRSKRVYNGGISREVSRANWLDESLEVGMVMGRIAVAG